MSELASIRASSLNGYRELVCALGGDPLVYLRQLNISPTLLEDEFEAYPLLSFVKLLELTANDLQCPDFGLRLAEAHGDRHLGPLGIVGANSSTVGSAMSEMIRNLDFHCPALMVQLDRKICPGKCTFTWDFSLPGKFERTQIDESAVGNIYQELKILAQGNCVPEMVLFRHSASKSIAGYRRYFHSPVFFDQEINGIVVKPELLNRKLVRTNRQLQKLALDYIRKALVNERPEVGAQVRHLIIQCLPTNAFGIGHVAGRLGMHQRTLQRRLRQQGLTFEAIVDSVREGRASELLRQSTLSMAEIAAQLGYTEQASFNRACMRWFGCRPSNVRQHSRHAA
jgi:AraC-like DNA-binding protein